MRAVEHGLSPERLASIDESVLRYLGSLAGKHPERFCTATLGLLYKLRDCCCPNYEVLLDRLRHLEEIGRLVPAQYGQQAGWIFVLGKDWRKARRQREGAPAPQTAAGGFTGRDREFLRQCGIVWE